MANSQRNTVKDEPRNREVSSSGGGQQITRRGDVDFSNPFAIMRRMHEEMDRVFGEAFGGRVGAQAGGGLMGWAPAVEVSERDNELTVCAELPGLKPEEVKVEVTEDALVIQGERKQQHEENEGGKWHSERHYGRFYRAIALPEGADMEHARADFKNGELKVTVPVQRPESKRRQIPIGGAGEKSQNK